jgi:hypothetical protein
MLWSSRPPFSGVPARLPKPKPCCIVSILSIQDLKLNKAISGRDTDKIHLARLEKYGNSA